MFGNREISCLARVELALVRTGKAGGPKPVMHGHEKSDPSVVAMKPANEGGRPLEELVEPREGAEGNTVEHTMRRTPSRESMSHGLDRVRRAARVRFAVKYPRWEPYAGNPPVRFCAGGAP